MWMRGRFCENVLHDASGQFACMLILFENDQHGHTGFDGRTGFSIHRIIL
jgi:hypothetical protein